MKHVALVATLQTSLTESRLPLFRYTDAFAGFSGYVLFPGGAWTRGVGRVDRRGTGRTAHVNMWMRWYLAKPSLAGMVYPGSAAIAADLAVDAGQEIKMTLWDESPEAVKDLKAVFRGRHRSVLARGIDPDARSVRTADFLFIDPPGVASRQKHSFPSWQLLMKLMNQGSHMLAWLPVNVGVSRGRIVESAPAEAQLEDARRVRGADVTRVQWAKGGRTIGCLLVYRLSGEGTTALRLAVEDVLTLCDWPTKIITHYAGVPNAG